MFIESITWGALLVALAVVTLPLRLNARGRVDDELEPEGELHLRWSWGIVSARIATQQGMEIYCCGTKIFYREAGVVWRSSVKQQDSLPDQPHRQASRRFQPGIFIRHRTAAIQLCKRLADVIMLKMRIVGEVGLHRPDQTAWVDILLRQIPNHISHMEIDLAANYLDDRMDIEGQMEITVFPIYVISTMALMLREQRIIAFLKEMKG